MPLSSHASGASAESNTRHPHRPYAAFANTRGYRDHRDLREGLRLARRSPLLDPDIADTASVEHVSPDAEALLFVLG